MGTWSIIQAEATENEVENPSFENDTTGATAVNSSVLTRVTNEQAIGAASLEVDPTTNTTGGVYIAISSVSTTTPYTASFSIKGVDGVDYEAYLYVNGAQIGDAVEFTGDGTWRRYSVTATTGGSSSGPRLYIRKNNDADSNPFYIDAVQVEAKSYATTYCDGDQDGCIWTAGAHSSTSIRSAQSATGGKVVDLVDTNNLGLNIKASVGVSMPDFELIDDISAQSDGADHQRTVARPRQFQLVGQLAGSSWSDLLSRRKVLMNLVSPRRLATDQPFEVRYNLDGAMVGIDARYEGGLNKGRVDGVSIEQISLRFKAQRDPFWRRALGVTGGQNGKRDDASSLSSAQDNLTSVNYIIKRNPDGTWEKMSTGLPQSPYDIIQADDGTIYAVGGAFSTSGYVKSWNGSSWSDVGTVPTVSDHFYRCAINPISGDLWVTLGGSATSPTFDYLAYYDGSWHASPVGNPNGDVYKILFNPDGTCYICGGFTTLGGSTARRIALIDGASFSQLDVGIASISGTGSAFCMTKGPDGKLYVGGVFDDAGGVSAKNIAVYDPATDSWAAMAGGVNSLVYDMWFGPDGNLYIVGEFSTANGKTVNRVCYWNGSDYFPLSTGFTYDTSPGITYFSRVFVDGNNIVYAIDNMTAAGGLTVPNRFAKWTGGAWAIGTAATLPSNALATSFLIANDGTLYIGFIGTGTAYFEQGF